MGNNNRFETREECAALCVKDDTVGELSTNHLELKIYVKFSDACEQDKDEGPCKGNYLRWYYDKNSKSCQQFIYGGCKSNNNNFPTEEACKQQCTQPGRKKGKSGLGTFGFLHGCLKCMSNVTTNLGIRSLFLTSGSG